MTCTNPPSPFFINRGHPAPAASPCDDCFRRREWGRSSLARPASAMLSLQDREVIVVPLAVVASALILITASSWSSILAQGSPPHQAPAGHRQPKASEVPQEEQLSPSDKKLKELDDALAKKLKS